METLEERIEWISLMHKQNLNGRETEDELFEERIRVGIEETEERMYSEEATKQISKVAFNAGKRDELDFNFEE